MILKDYPQKDFVVENKDLTSTTWKRLISSKSLKTVRVRGYHTVYIKKNSNKSFEISRRVSSARKSSGRFSYGKYYYRHKQYKIKRFPTYREIVKWTTLIEQDPLLRSKQRSVKNINKNMILCCGRIK